jgi:hypothetical protein
MPKCKGRLELPECWFKKIYIVVTDTHIYKIPAEDFIYSAYSHLDRDRLMYFKKCRNCGHEVKNENHR